MANYILSPIEKKERTRAACRRYYERNKEKILVKQRARIREKYALDPEKFKERTRKYRTENYEKCQGAIRAFDRKKWLTSSEDARKSGYLASAKSRAKKKQLPFEITIDDFYLPTHCPLLGVELDYSVSSGYNPNHASLDRKNPHLGYVPGNVWILSRKANLMKNNATYEELHRFVVGLKMFGLVP